MRFSLLSFVAELEKIAKEGDRAPWTLGEGLVGAGTVVAPLVGHRVAMELPREAMGKLTKKDVSKLLSSMGLDKVKSNLRIIRGEGGLSVGKGKYKGKYLIDTPPRHPEVLAHEAGHLSRRLTGGPVTRAIHYIPGKKLHRAGALIGAGMAALPEDDRSKIIAAAPYVTAGTAAPMIIEEVGATGRAMKALKALGKYTPRALGSMRANLIKDLGTYLATGGTALLPVSYIAYKRGKKAKEKKA